MQYSELVGVCLQLPADSREQYRGFRALLASRAWRETNVQDSRILKAAKSDSATACSPSRTGSNTCRRGRR
jgi:hypothetical protein